MSLDLGNTAIQIDKMALLLKARHGDRTARLQEALRAVDAFDAAEYERKRQAIISLHWPVPQVPDSLREIHPAPPIPRTTLKSTARG